MTNLEKYEELIKRHVENGNIFGIVEDRPVECRNVSNCNKCNFFTCCSSASVVFNWLFKEAKKSYNITKEELAFCNMVKTGYLWRDSKNNNLFYFKKEPKKTILGDYATEYNNTIFLNRLLFPSFSFVKNELISIEDILSNYSLL